MTMDLDPRLVFERFVVEPGNGLAAAAARRAAESPGGSYNPLVICGPAGVGKTHLLSSIGHLAASIEPGRRVRYDTPNGLVERLTGYISEGRLEAFREEIAATDLFLLDDLQEIAGKARTQNELLLACETLVESGSQIVIASDRPPHQVPALDARLISWLATGLVVEIGGRDDVLPARVVDQAADEFSDFLSDLSTAVAGVVETALSRAIHRWEGEDFRVGGLPRPLDADSPRDADALLAVFGREAPRLREIERKLLAPPVDPPRLKNPDQPRAAGQILPPRDEGPRPISFDPWFGDREKLAWNWTALEDLLIEEPG